MLDYVNPPIMCVLGDRGDGKTLLMTGLGYLYNKVDGMKVYANYHLIGIPYEYITFEILASFPEDLVNAVVLMDEAHIGADAYEVFRKTVKAITTFATQLRKRNVILIWSTQRFNTVAKRLRQMTNYVLEVQKTNIEGMIDIKVFDRSQPASNSFLNEFIFNGKKYFKMYDTNEIIEP
jgi:archaellum biogenesis ATPase FlaH